MKADDEMVETSHGPATVKYVREHDIPHWQSAAAHALGVVRKLAEIIGMEREPDWVPLAHAMFKAWGPMTTDGAWFDYQTKAQLLVEALNSPAT